MAQHQHIFYGFGSLEKGRAATKKNRATPKNSDHSMAIRTVASNGDEQPISSVCSEVWNSLQPKKSRWRLNDIILKSVKNLNEPTGSHRTTIANYIEVCILVLFSFRFYHYRYIFSDLSTNVLSYCLSSCLSPVHILSRKCLQFSNFHFCPFLFSQPKVLLSMRASHIWIQYFDFTKTLNHLRVHGEALVSMD